MTYPYLSGITYESVVDGPGVRAAIFLSGCEHNCCNCHNPETHNPYNGYLLNEAMIYTIAHLIYNRSFISGITLTGGDPLYNIEATLNFLNKLKEDLDDTWNFLNKWLYTGYTWEQLMQRYHSNMHLQKLLSMIDVIVDGPYVESLSDKSLAFKGSSNQRIIDVQESLKRNTIILWNHIS